MATQVAAKKTGPVVKRTSNRGRPRKGTYYEMLTGRQPSRRTPVVKDAQVADPLSGNPPADLLPGGKGLWSVLCAQQAALAEKEMTPAITMDKAPLAHAYCASFDDWMSLVKLKKKMTSGRHPELDRSGIYEDEDGKLMMSLVFKEERLAKKALYESAKALGINTTLHMNMMQVNVVSDPANAHPAFQYMGGPYAAAREAAAEGANAKVVQGEVVK